MNSPLPRILILLALGLGSVHLSACRSFELGKKSVASIERVLDLRRAPSLEPWKNGSAEKQTIVDQAPARIGLLFDGWDTMKISTKRKQPDKLTFKFHLNGQKRGGMSTAVPISSDGYFLTASHSVDEDPLILVALTSDQELSAQPARLVWRGEYKKGGPDLAIIHAPLVPILPFPLADSDTVKTKANVAITGASGLHPPTPAITSAAGNITKLYPVSHDPIGAPWRIIEHDIPLSCGDSGGPLFNEKGECIGINTGISVDLSTLFLARLGYNGSASRPVKGYRGLAVAGDSKWIKREIAKDRARQHR